MVNWLCVLSITPNHPALNYTRININNIIGITNNKKQKLFTIYEGLKLFLSKEEYESLTEKLRELLSLLEFKLKDIIDTNDILYKMDFPKDWHK